MFFVWSVLGLTVLGWVIVFMSPPSTQSPASEPEPATRVLSTELFRDYDTNAIAADNHYRPPLIVEGKVKGIGKDITGVPYLVLGDREDVAQGVQALFERDPSGLAQVTRGERVAIRCERNSGRVLMNVILRQCSLVN
jgi:hypothetical protein